MTTSTSQRFSSTNRVLSQYGRPVRRLRPTSLVAEAKAPEPAPAPSAARQAALAGTARMGPAPRADQRPWNLATVAMLLLALAALVPLMSV